MTEFFRQFGSMSDFAVIGGELLAILLLVVVTNIVIRVLMGRAARLSGLARFSGQIDRLGIGLRRLTWVGGVLTALAAVIFNGYLIIQGQDILTYNAELLAELPPGFWVQLGIGLAVAVIAAIAARTVLRGLGPILDVWERFAKDYDQITANDESIERFFRLLRRLATAGIWLLVVLFGARTLPFPAAVDYYLGIFVNIYLIVAGGLLLIQAIAALVESLDALVAKHAADAEENTFLSYYSHMASLVPLLRRSLEYTIYVMAITLILRQDSRIARWAEFGPPIIQIIGIFFLSRVAVEATSLIIQQLMLGNAKSLKGNQRQQRETLTPVFKSLVKYAVYFIAFVLILNAVNLNPTPFLAGAGIVGIVVGLSAQSLLSDIVSGFFILFESLYMVGDYIETGPAKGVVEAIDIRTTRIRDNDGQLYILRNGQINEITNFSKTYTHAVVKVGVAYESNLDQVYAILRKLGEELHAANPNVIAPTQVMGLDDFGASELTIKTVTRVKPGKHLPVAREYRKMIKEAFDREGIEIPFAQQVVSFKGHPELLRIASVASDEEERNES